MEYREEQQAEKIRLVLQGNLDIYAVAELRDQLVAALAKAHILELDLSEIEEIDGAGIQLLMVLKKSALNQGCQLQLSNHSPAVITTLELCRLTSFFGDPIYLHCETDR